MLAECERYQIVTAAARADIEFFTGKKISAPALNGDVVQNFEALKKHAVELTGKMEKIAASVKAGTLKSAEITAIEQETAAIKLEIEEIRAQTVAAEKEKAQLEKEIAKMKIERDFWKAKAEPVLKQLAAQLVEHGISRPGRVKVTGLVKPSVSFTKMD